MGQVSKFNEWKSIKEVRTKRKCTIPDFTPLRETDLYKDLISLGYVEVNARGEERLADERYQVAYQGEKQGNLRFKHEKFPRTIRMNLNGAVWEDDPYNFDQDRSGKAYRIQIEWDSDPKWYKACLTIDDYKNRLEYLIKKLLYEDRFITRSELLNVEGGVEIIKRKIDENIDNIKKLRTVPPSLQQDADYLKTAADYGLF
jgi:hypothetical protein